MKRGLSDVLGLVERAQEFYEDDEDALRSLGAYARRLREPLRLAVAGMVKAGKSTLLNALIGEQIAPTDAGECTRVITWYRHARSARITVHLKDGTKTRMPVKRDNGALVLDLGRITADEVDWIDVEWPSESLRSLVLIDTPGIASLSEDVSARSTRFFAPEKSSSDADAILYLLRHIHASDVKFLEAFHDTAAGESQTVNAVALLSRSDEIGSGRIDSLLSAARIADRYRRDGELRALALGCIPVAGLLAEGARTLQEKEFLAFKELAGLDRQVRERLMISVDRFTRSTDATTLSVTERRVLLSRFGIFGIRLGTTLVRSGAKSSSELAERMVQQSGLTEVQKFVADQFRSRATALKARGILDGLEELLTSRPRDGSDVLLGELERIRFSGHDLRELTLLSELRTSIPPLAPDDLESAERIIGGSGAAKLSRLGLPDGTDREVVDARIHELLTHWHDVSASPLADRHTTEIGRTVIRSLEGLAS